MVPGLCPMKSEDQFVDKNAKKPLERSGINHSAHISPKLGSRSFRLQPVTLFGYLNSLSFRNSVIRIQTTSF